MNIDIPDDLIEIHDPDIDPTQIMAEIRARIQKRRDQLGYESREFPSFDVASYPGEPDDIPLDANLYHYLRLANNTYNQASTEPILAESPATRLPIVGPIWQRVRGQVHQLVLFYVNRAVKQQTTMNRYMVSTLNRLTLQAQAQQRTIMALQTETEALRRQLEQKP